MTTTIDQCVDRRGHVFMALIRVRLVIITWGGKKSASVVSILPLPHSRYLFPTTNTPSAGSKEETEEEEEAKEGKPPPPPPLRPMKTPS